MITDRILRFIELKDINKNQFYKKTGLSNGFLDKVRDIGASKIEQILTTFPEINPEWLLTGNGDMLKTAGSVAEKESSQSEILALLRWKVSKLEEENAELKKELRAKDPGPVTPAKSELKSER